jgi:hypothetical protein
MFSFDGSRVLTVMDADGTNKHVIVTLPPAKDSWDIVYAIVPSWSPDGTSIVFGAQRHRIEPDIWAATATGATGRCCTSHRHNRQVGVEPGLLPGRDDDRVLKDEREAREHRPLDDGGRWVERGAADQLSKQGRVRALVAADLTKARGWGHARLRAAKLPADRRNAVLTPSPGADRAGPG